LLAFTDGVDIWEFGINADYTTTTMTALAKSGDTPTTTADAYHLPSLQYFPAPYSCYVMGNYKQVSVYKR
jgi:hypothetical protein